MTLPGNINANQLSDILSQPERGFQALQLPCHKAAPQNN